MTSPSPSATHRETPADAAPAREQPLSPARAAGLVVAATGILLLFYAYVAIALAVLVAAMLLGVAVALVAARVGALQMVMNLVRRVHRVFRAVLGSVGLGRAGTEWEMQVERADAPGLFALMEETCARLGAAVPQRVVLTMGSNAFVQLRGLLRGRGRTSLGMGYDLLASLPRAHVAAVVAHEIAHARLIQRGFQGWLFRGNARVQGLTATLRAMASVPHREGGSDSARALAWAPGLLAPACNRLAAAYSRQHEFAADRLAAQVHGADATAAALVETHVVVERGGRVEWRDRVAQVERGGSFAAWLRERLLPETPEERARLERRVLAERTPQALSTHPALPDRLRALPRTSAGTAAAEGGPALDLLADPDGMAVRLVRHLEDLAEAEGRRESEALRRRVRRKMRGKGLLGARIGRMLLLLGPVLMAMAGLAVWFSTAPGAGHGMGRLAAFGAAVAVMGGVLVHLFRWRDRLPVPMPPIARLVDVLDVPQRERMPGEWSAEVEAALRASMPDEVRRSGRRRRAHLAKAAYAALEACDFRTAYVAGRLCLAERPRMAEGQIAFGVAGAYLAGKGLGTLEAAISVAGAGPSLSWAVGWAAAMLGDLPAAEAYLLDAVAYHPHAATPAALLGQVQARMGRPREAERALRQAVAARPGEPWQREALVNVLLSTGRARSARQELEALHAMGAAGVGVRVQALRTHVLLGEDGDALEAAEALACREPGPATELRIAGVLEDGESAALRDAAERWYAGPAEGGFHAPALLGMAGLAFRRGDRPLARRRLLAGMDATRPRDPASAGVVELFPAFCRGLRALEEPERCGAWWFTLPLSTAPDGVTGIRVLTCHGDRGRAAALAEEVRAALDPAAPAGAPLVAADAAARETPGDLVAPGIYHHAVQRAP